ncbi:MAG TPA: glutathione S-transferase family protein [Rhizomicrobium sp.]|jgi:glutathione S-transferase|nr:glutathione S-transferase family protein [Rhizomicrobium sp.]
MITVSAFKWVPQFAQGQVRDLRVRWALEEAGLPYREMLIGGADKNSAAYRALQPFGQVPAIEEDGLTLFESGAIVLYIGAKSEALLPKDEEARARAITWVFAALNTMEVVIQPYAELSAFYANEEWAKLRKPELEQQMKLRLSELAAQLGTREYLEDRFTAGDLMMASVLRILDGTGVLDTQPVLEAYKERCIARPAFQRALAAQLAAFEKHKPAA